MKAITNFMELYPVLYLEEDDGSNAKEVPDDLYQRYLAAMVEFAEVQRLLGNEIEGSYWEDLLRQSKEIQPDKVPGPAL